MDRNEWMELIKELNAGQPDLMDLIQQQIDSYEGEKNNGKA